MISAAVCDSILPLAHQGTMVIANKTAAVATAATIWLRVSDEKNSPMEMNSDPTRTMPR